MAALIRSHRVVRRSAGSLTHAQVRSRSLLPAALRCARLSAAMGHR